MVATMHASHSSLAPWTALELELSKHVLFVLVLRMVALLTLMGGLMTMVADDCATLRAAE